MFCGILKGDEIRIRTIQVFKKLDALFVKVLATSRRCDPIKALIDTLMSGYKIELVKIKSKPVASVGTT